MSRQALIGIFGAVRTFVLLDHVHHLSGTTFNILIDGYICKIRNSHRNDDVQLGKIMGPLNLQNLYILNGYKKQINLT